MDISTLGALLRFAMELEEQHLTVYQGASEKTEEARIKETFLNLAQQNKKSESQLERLYQENIFSDMDVGVQEPIPGLNRSDYLDESELLSDVSDSDLLTLAIHQEERSQKFYLDAALQCEARRPSVARSLGKLAKEKLGRKAELELLDTDTKT